MTSVEARVAAAMVTTVVPLRLACQRRCLLAMTYTMGSCPSGDADGVVRPRARRAWWGYGPGLGPGSAPVLQPA
eukprot:scaffold67291_cov70-Phaeocystis_antarctica.AAC.1